MSVPRPFVFGESLRCELKEIVKEALREEMMTIGKSGHSETQDGLINVEEAAEYLSVSKAWLYKNASRLPFAKKIGGSRRFDIREMRRWLETRTMR